MPIDTAMANLKGKQFGFGDVVIFISSKTRNHALPRFKVSNIPGKAAKMQDSFSVVLHENEIKLVGEVKLEHRVVAKILLWAERNRPTLIAYWEGDIETVDDFLDAVKRKK